MQLGHLPRVPLAFLPTPVEEAPRLSAALGGPRILVKRGDQTGLALGGNKARKLEFLMGEARRMGLQAVLVLGGPAPAVVQGNRLLDHLLGADVRFAGAKDDLTTERASAPGLFAHAQLFEPKVGRT